MTAIEIVSVVAASTALVGTLLAIAVLSREILVREAPVKIAEGLDVARPILERYYVDFADLKYLNVRHTFDGDGVPLWTFQGGTYYHPVFIAQFGLGAYAHYLRTRNGEARDSFLRSANWLQAHLRERGPFHFWEYRIPFEHPGIRRTPFLSAMAQGQGASVLLRAYVETGDRRYLENAGRAIEPILHDLSGGGVSVIKGKGDIFPQELPTDPPSNILNGAIFAYFGIHDYARVTGDPRVTEADDSILGTLERALPRYDAGFWSMYSEWPRWLAEPFYHSLHVGQLRMLYLISGRPTFLTYSDRFAVYATSYIDRLRYVVANHARQLREFAPSDIKKIPDFVIRTVTGRPAP
jgi:hypothetical protein